MLPVKVLKHWYIRRHAPVPQVPNAKPSQNYHKNKGNRKFIHTVMEKTMCSTPWMILLTHWAHRVVAQATKVLIRRWLFSLTVGTGNCSKGFSIVIFFWNQMSFMCFSYSGRGFSIHSSFHFRLWTDFFMLLFLSHLTADLISSF